MKTDDQKIGARVKAARIEAGLNQEVLANYLGLRVMAISKKEAGTIVITAPQIAKIANALGKPVTFFLQDVLK
jgi:transcriptional regulator with XRE-family HTH domain